MKERERGKRVMGSERESSLESSLERVRKKRPNIKSVSQTLSRTRSHTHTQGCQTILQS